jgi:hypothetical protein
MMVFIGNQPQLVTQQAIFKRAISDPEKLQIIGTGRIGDEIN